MKLYNELASWWPLLSSPDGYLEEATFFYKMLITNCPSPPKTVLELGSGGGSNASHLKSYFDLTLVDASAQMLTVSRALNPECQHLQGDMRTIRLEKLFDAVFIHDAIMYMTTEADLRMVMETAFVHCKPGGVALFVPDHTRETFEPGTEQGGDDGEDRGLRYLEWTYDPDPTDSTYEVKYALILRDRDGSVRFEHDEYQEGLFSHADWLQLLMTVGFEVNTLQDDYQRDLFVGRK
jgi:hypothetical protein